MRFTIVTPSFNQGVFIERTIESVLTQRGDFELEYLVVDGGSTDGTVELLKRYGERLTWTSERDRGQSDAINKGFARATGGVLAWLNSDDVYEPGALEVVARAFRDTGARWCFGECANIDEHDREIRRAITRYKNRLSRRYSLRRLLERDFISQPAVFFRRELLAEVGPLDEGCLYSMDYDLWLRFARRAEPVFIPRRLARFRWHGKSKNGSSYRGAAWETYRTACRHARRGERGALLSHLAHFFALVGVYGVLEAAHSWHGSNAP